VRTYITIYCQRDLRRESPHFPILCHQRSISFSRRTGISCARDQLPVFLGLAPERRPSTLLPHNTGGNISTSIFPLSPSPTLHALRNLWRRCALIYRSWPVWTTISDIYVIARACLNRRQRIVESLCTGFGFHQEDNSRGDV
jgi:hypothetical protein